MSKEPELFVLDLADFLESLSSLKKEIRANDEYTSEFKRGSDFICNFLLDNYGEVMEELSDQKENRMH